MNPYLKPRREPCDGCRHHAGRCLTFNGTSYLPTFIIFHTFLDIFSPSRQRSIRPMLDSKQRRVCHYPDHSKHGPTIPANPFDSKLDMHTILESDPNCYHSPRRIQ